MIDAGMNRPASTSTTPTTNTAPKPDQHADRQQLAVDQSPAPLFQFGLIAGQLVEPLVELHAAAELRNQPAGPIHRGRQIAARRGRPAPIRSAAASDSAVLLGGRRGLLRLLPSAARHWRNRLAGDRSGASVLVENAGSAAGSDFKPNRSRSAANSDSDSADLALQLADLALQLGDPRLLFLEGLDPRGLTPQGLVDGQRGKLPLGLLAQPGKMVEPLLMFLRCGR